MVAFDAEEIVMLTTNAFAEIGALLGDPARANMLVALMDGRALTASELASTSGVTPQTASSHLNRLVGAGLLFAQSQGRHRYHRLATPAIAQMVEGMMAVAVDTTIARRPAPWTGPRDQAMRQARTCYDHLAGRLAVAITDALVTRNEIELGGDGGELTGAGAALLEKMGVDLGRLSGRGRSKRVFCRPCLDWSERRPHIAGLVGMSLLDCFLDKNWIRRVPGSRAVSVPSDGRRNLTALFDLKPEVWDNTAT